MTWLEALKNALLSRRTHYNRTFNAPSGKEVMEDLAKFCRGLESTFNKDPYIAARLDGRREVFLRICHHLKLSPDELFEMYSGIRPQPRED